MAEWKEFEAGVAAFIAAIGQGAKVSRDVMIPDKDTGRPRQRDVWVEVPLFGLFNLKVLISCKMLQKPLNSQDMDAFIGELQSARAQKGVIYSHSGFTKPALEKAAVHDISCCKLYRNEPADIPEQLVIRCYCYMPRIQLGMQGTTILSELLGMTFRELFDIKIRGEGPTGTVLDALVAEYERAEGQAMEEVRRGKLPEAFEAGIGLEREEDEGEAGTLQIGMRIGWRVYKSRLDAQLMEGTYAFGENKFVGRQRSPVIDLSGNEPGPGWERITNVLRELAPPYAMLVGRGDVRDTLERLFADKKVEEIFIEGLRRGHRRSAEEEEKMQ